MKTTKMDLKVGIYDSELAIRDYGNKICLTIPYVRWVNNSGSLDFEKQTIKSPRIMTAIRRFAKAGKYVFPDGDMLADYIDI